MKKVLALLIACMFIDASAQTVFNKRVVCGGTEQIINTLTGKDYREKPIWMGVNEQDNTFSIFVNNQTKSWTIIEFKGKTACILGSGEESQFSQELGIQ